MKTSITLIILIIVLGFGFYFMNSAPDSSEEARELDNEGSSMEVMDNEVMEAEDTVESDEVTVEAGADVGVDTGALTQVVNVDGFNFGFSEDEIRVKEGATVTINFKSTDGFHDWVVDEFGASTAKVQTGDTTSVTFVADKAGTYEYYCSVGQHRANGMVGTLIVE